MTTTFADLEARVRGQESRAQRAEEDVTAIINTVVETRDDIQWLKRAVQARRKGWYHLTSRALAWTA